MEIEHEIEKLITPQELTDILRLKQSFVYRLLRLGQIPSVRVTNGKRKQSLRVSPRALRKWLAAREVAER